MEIIFFVILIIKYNNKIFNMNYYEVKYFIYQELKKLGKQIEENIFLKDVV